ncbi:MAG: PIN domain-containing protein [Bacteroidales bacterium]|nr:PIN domain-containing protein [Bacteroidales bacterium]MCF8333853.1 PIN domain-containing protein [Bacteroidales bacterium]
MNGKLLDTNILIYLSKKELGLEDISSSKSTLYISVITYMEALGFDFQKESEKNIIEKLCSGFKVIHLDHDIVQRVIIIRKKHKIKLPDTIILASAELQSLELVTANSKDFNNVDAKILINNPFQ